MKTKHLILLGILLVSPIAMGEMFPSDDDSEPKFRMSDEYRPAKRQYRYGGQDAKGKPISEQERKRRSVENYLDAQQSGRRDSRSYRGRGRRPRAYGTQSGVRRRRPRVNYEAGQTEAPQKYYAKPDSYAYEPQQYQRSYQEEAPARNSIYQNPNTRSAPPESYAGPQQKLNYQNPFSARPAPNPFREGPSPSNKNLLDVKRWAQQPDRKVASLDRRNPMRTEEDMEQDFAAPKEWAVRLSLVGGLSSATNSDQNTQTTRENLALGDNFYLGAQADVVAYRYFGAEGDFYYGIAPPITVIEDSGESVQSLQQWGFMGDVKAQAPIPMAGNRFITPKLGLGYGMLGMNETQESDASASEAFMLVSGVYFMAGADAQVSDKITLGLDYAMSMGASAVVDSTNSASAAEAAGSFNRLRIGAYWKFTESLGIGAQFVNRQITVGEGTSAGSESLTQFLGVLQIHL